MTKRKIPDKFEPVVVTFDEGVEGKMAVINNIVVVQVNQSQKAWCSANVTNFFAKTCLFEVQPMSTICNYDKARGHLDVCVKTQIGASGRVPLETAPEISKHTQANDLFINAAFQSNLRKVATKYTISKLFEAISEQEPSDEESVSGGFAGVDPSTEGGDGEPTPKHGGESSAGDSDVRVELHAEPGESFGGLPGVGVDPHAEHST